MNITEMHVWFRQYAQQMGMQNVRALLPEQIDLLINTSINDVINQIITQNIVTTNDRVITDNSKIGQINALRSLYKVLLVNAVPSPYGAISPSRVFNWGNETYIKKIQATINSFADNFDYLFLVDLSLNYTDKDSYTATDAKITNYYPVRLIDDIYLADTLNDFILKPRLRSPISVIYNNTMDIYLDENINGSLPHGLTPHELRVSYIAKPAKVAYLADLDQTNVDCDLPEYLHVDILKHAVDLYRTSISGGLYGTQQQAQQQEDNNNYRQTQQRQ